MSLGSVEQAFLLWLWTKTSDTASERVCVRAPVKEGTREQRTRLEQVLQVLSKLFIKVFLVCREQMQKVGFTISLS